MSESGEAAWLTQMDAASPVTDDAAARELDFARLYMVFEQDPRGRALLDHWKQTIGRRRLQPTASLQEYAFAEGQRMFVQGIQEQIEKAQQG